MQAQTKPFHCEFPVEIDGLSQDPVAPHRTLSVDRDMLGSNDAASPQASVKRGIFAQQNQKRIHYRLAPSIACRPLSATVCSEL
jgi:hypothetical protein